MSHHIYLTFHYNYGYKTWVIFTGFLLVWQHQLELQILVLQYNVWTGNTYWSLATGTWHKSVKQKEHNSILNQVFCFSHYNKTLKLLSCSLWNYLLVVYDITCLKSIRYHLLVVKLFACSLWKYLLVVYEITRL